MSLQESRPLIAHALIAVSVCAGAYLLLVQGPSGRLAAARAEADALAIEVSTAESLREKVPQMNAALDRVRAEAARIRTLGRPARDERGLFAAVMALAGAHDVRIDELNPTRAATSGVSTPPLGAERAPRSGDAQVGYTIVAIATYDDLFAFVAGLESDLGHSMVRAVRIVPLQDDRSRLVRAVIETAHYSFDTTAHAPGSLAEGGKSQ
jgi:hypothetical protein